VSNGLVHEVLSGLSGVDHETVGELKAVEGRGVEVSETRLSKASSTVLRPFLPKSRVSDGTYLHGLGPGSSQLTGDDDLASLSSGLHDESKDSVAGSSDGKSSEELVSKGLGLGDGGKSSVLDLLGVELEGVLGELEKRWTKGGGREEDR